MTVWQLHFRFETGGIRFSQKVMYAKGWWNFRKVAAVNSDQSVLRAFVLRLNSQRPVDIQWPYIFDIHDCNSRCVLGTSTRKNSLAKFFSHKKLNITIKVINQVFIDSEKSLVYVIYHYKLRGSNFYIEVVNRPRSMLQLFRRKLYLIMNGSVAKWRTLVILLWLCNIQWINVNGTVKICLQLFWPKVQISQNRHWFDSG